MKIGILTFHKGTNYGGFLQCFALFRFLSEQGHEVSVIDYVVTRRRSFLRRNTDRLLSISSWSDVWDIVRALFKKGDSSPLTMTPAERQRAGQLFEQARESRLVLTQSVDELSIASVANAFDAIVIGSDQVWADVHEKQPVFLGDWTPVFPGKLIAYAACSPLKAVQRPYRKRNAGLLSRFAGISVRDEHTAEIFRKVRAGQYPVAADPTLLYGGWEDAEASVETGGRYILLFIIRREIDGTLQDAVARLKGLHPGCKVLAILTTETRIRRDTEGIDEFSVPDPFQWVWLIRYAECVLTDSYHCALFAFQFSVPFFVYYRKSDPGKCRLLELKERFGLAKNLITCTAEITHRPDMPDASKGKAEFISSSRRMLAENLERRGI